ncbi:O-antigen ligase [Deinococcus sp. JMULE3]|uniref:O-antigen ligase family protein n=1 Tax=Deinococcus sp. JMULE3 TaxID=2518341 RepID=UPI00157595F0|nr:hypothetical protein [Deinococcus sp. JMULE3]NTY01070.1 hypothetical protein [Deinococcus sp. JMULE3]
MIPLLPATLSGMGALDFALLILKQIGIFYMILFGFHLNNKDIKYLIPGICLASIIAIFYSYWPDFGLSEMKRLIHPYFTTTTLGFIGSIAIILSFEIISRNPIPRIILFLSGATLFTFSYSRGAILMAAVYAVVKFSVVLSLKKSEGKSYIAYMPLAFGLIAIGVSTTTPIGERLLSSSLSGRELIWDQAISNIDSYRNYGNGIIGFGQSIASLHDSSACTNTSNKEFFCDFLDGGFHNAWLIAHNGILQNLGESGVTGLFSIVFIFGIFIYAAAKSRSIAGISIIGGMILADAFDNTLSFQTFFISSIPLIYGGMSIKSAFSDDTQSLRGNSMLTAFVIFAIWYAPLVPLQLDNQHTSELRVWHSNSIGESKIYSIVTEKISPTSYVQVDACNNELCRSTAIYEPQRGKNYTSFTIESRILPQPPLVLRLKIRDQSTPAWKSNLFSEGSWAINE